MHRKERSILFYGQILYLDVNLFEDGGSIWINNMEYDYEYITNL
jgi:hypothetical protein